MESSDEVNFCYYTPQVEHAGSLDLGLKAHSMEGCALEPVLGGNGQATVSGAEWSNWSELVR